MKTPCANCAEREVGCHGKCDRYQAYRDDIEHRKKPELYAKCDYDGYVRDMKVKIALGRMGNPRRGFHKDE